MQTTLIFVVFGLVALVTFMYNKIRKQKTEIKSLNFEVKRLKSIINPSN